MLDLFKNFPITAVPALLCGLSAPCWCGDGYNYGRNLHCQRGKEIFVILSFKRGLYMCIYLFIFIILVSTFNTGFGKTGW